ncbi:hypothetical protein GN956_G5077 [Arapaima gigas]
MKTQGNGTEPSPSADTDTGLGTGMQLRPRSRLHSDNADLTRVKPKLICHDGTTTNSRICTPDPEAVVALTHPVDQGGKRHSSGNREEEAEGTSENNKVTEEDSEESETDSGETEDSNVPEEDVDDEDEYNEEEEAVDSGAPGESSGEHRCKVCDVTLPSAFWLLEHMHLHSGTRPYRCSECGKQFCHLANYRTHLRSHAKATAARCRVCKASFQSVESLQTHLETSHLEKEFYQCDYCKRIFTCLNECQRHLELHRLNLVRHQCPRCGRHFHRQKSLTRHLARHNKHRMYLCTECGQSFPKKTILFRHSFSHLGLLPYTCIRCQRHFRLASLYHKHECKPERIQCVACLGFFHSQRDFQRHKKETGCWGHQGAKGDEIRCMECGQAFGSVEELKKHAGAHQRVLTCSECGKGFHSALLLMSHMGGHASQRPYLCQRCGLGFPHQQAYDSHQKDCGRVNPAQGAAKKPKKTEPAKAAKSPEQSDKPAEDAKEMWQLALEKMPPSGAALVVYLPVPTSSSNPLGATLCKAVPADDALKAEVPRVAPELSADERVPAETDPSGNSGPALELAIPGHPVAPAAVQFAEMQQPLLTLSNASDHTAAGLPGPAVAGVSPHVAGLAVVPPMTSQILRETVNPTVGAEGMRAGMVRLADEVGDLQKPTVVLGLETVGSTGIQSGLRGRTEELVASSKGGGGGGEVGIVIKMENKPFTCLQSDAVLTSSKVKEEACTTHTGWLEPGGSGTRPSVSLTPVKCEMRSDKGIDVMQEDDRGGSLEDGKDGGTRSFDCVEVEIWDDVEGDVETDEPHECINCGRILLDGNLLEHYMQHAAESDCPFPEESSEPRLPSRCPRRPRKKQKSRKKR